MISEKPAAPCDKTNNIYYNKYYIFLKGKQTNMKEKYIFTIKIPGRKKYNNSLIMHLVIHQINLMFIEHAWWKCKFEINWAFPA